MADLRGDTVHAKVLHLLGDADCQNITIRGQARGLLRLFGIGQAITGTVPLPTAALLVQTDTVVQAYATGGIVVTFPRAFPSSLFFIAPVGGDANVGVSQFQLVAASLTLSSFKVKCYTSAGAEFTNGQNLRLDYMALGS